METMEIVTCISAVLGVMVLIHAYVKKHPEILE